MKSKIRVTLLFVVLFVIATSSLFAQTRAFDDTHIDVEIVNPGPLGKVVINSTVKVSLTDPEYSAGSSPPNEISEAWVNFLQFEGPASVPMVFNNVTLKWEASYLVQGGTLNHLVPTAKVVVKGNFWSGGESTIPDDELFMVNNIPAAIGALDILTTVTNPGLVPTNVAIVGSTITVTFTSNVVSSASVSFADFGGGVVNMLESPADVFTATYNVVAGNNVGSYKIKVTAYEGGNPNPGVAEDNDFTHVDNKLPELADFVVPAPYLGANGDYSAEFVGAEGILNVHANLNPRITKVTIDWNHTFPSMPPLAPVTYNVIAGLLQVAYPVPNTVAFSPGLEVRISSMMSAAGNVTGAGFEKLINTNIDGDPIAADTLPPTFVAGDMDLYYNNDPATGWLRFSPNSPVVAGYGNTDNDYVNLKLRLTNWGAPGNISKLRLRFEFEGRSVYTRDYQVGAPTVSYTAPELTIAWDGKAYDSSNVLQDMANGTYGVTLWRVWDAAGNTLDLSDDYIIANEYPPHSPLLNDDGAPQVILNRMHVVVDNTPLTYLQTLNSTDALTFTHRYHTDRFTGDVPFAPVVTENWDNNHTSAAFTFQAQRDFRVDSNQLRWEKGKYWIVQTDGTNNWYWNGSAWVAYAAFDYATMRHDLVFPTDTHQNANTIGFTWSAANFAPFTADYTLTVDGVYTKTYTVTAYLQDNAGNIVASDVKTITSVLHVTNTTYNSNVAVVNNLEIVNQHFGGDYSLPPFDGEGDHNFYLSQSPYYASIDTIAVKITLNNKNYLKAGNSVLLDLTSLGLGQVWKTAANFNASNETIHYITNAQMLGLPVSKAGEWILGTGAGANLLPVKAYSPVTQPDLSVIDYETVYAGQDKFNLVVPAPAVYPTPGTVAISDAFFSPGHPSHTYNALFNPANDGIQDSTRITISVPASTYPLEWELEVKNPITSASWTRNGDLAASVGLPPTTHVFAGLSDALGAMADSTGVQAMDVKLYVRVTQYADDGYLDATNPAPATAPLTIDNQNPKVVARTGYTYNDTTKTLTFATTPVISGVSNTFEVTIKTSEALRTANINQLGSLVNQFPGWGVAAVLSPTGEAIPGASGQIVSATQVATNEYKLVILVDGVAGLELPNSIMVLRLPWDEAGNPGRYNNPVYPVALDLFHNDSAEVNFPIHILNARPWISKIQFTNYQSVGVVEYNEAGTQTSATQGYVNNYTNSSGTLEAWISGGISRDVVTTFKADVSSISTMANASALPGTPVAEGGLWKLSWNVTNLRSDLVHNAAKVLTVFANTMEGANQLHGTSKTISIIVDKVTPVLSSSTFDGTNNTVVADGTAKPFTYNISDALANIYWDLTNSISLTFSNGVTHSGFAYDNIAGTVTGNITLPANTAIKNFIATFKVKDKVNNELTATRNINVLPAPMPSNVVLTGIVPTAAPYFKPGTDVTVNFDVSNYQRADKIDVKLFNVNTGLQVGATQTITAPTLGSYVRTFTAVTIPHTNVLRADVIVTYSKYDNATAALNTNATNTATSTTTNTNLIADGTNPNGLPVIVATAGSLDYITEGMVQNLSFDISDAHAGVNWTTPTLSFNPAAGIAIAALDTSVAGKARWDVTVDPDIVAQRVIVTITATDNVGNTATLLRYLNVMPVPAVTVTNISVTDNNPVNPDPTNWFVPGHDLKVSFNISDPQRVNQLTVTLTADGVVFAQAAQTFNVGSVSDPMNVIFANVDPANLDGKVLRATVTGHTLSYSNAVTGTTSTTPLTGSGDFDEINVDTEPIIQSVVFYLDPALTTPIDYINSGMQTIYAMVQVKSPNDLVIPTITLPGIEGVITPILTGGPVVTGAGADRILTYTYTINITSLAYDSSSLYAVANFAVNTSTIYGYAAPTYTHGMVVLGDPTADIYGVLPADRSFADVGRAPDRWFAPEHDLITEYSFVSSFGPDSLGIAADFDRIEDNVPDNWNYTPTLTHTMQNIPLAPARSVVLYNYLAVWNITPDYASVWNAYQDGQPIQVDYKYWSFLPTMITDTTMVHVDKEVPTYDETRYWVATATGNNPPAYETITSLAGASFKNINLPLTPPAPGTWAADQHVYLKVATKDDDGVIANPYNGAGAGWVLDPIATGWNVEAGPTSRDGAYFYTEWKFSPVDADSINANSILHIELQGVEDLVGHKNYIGDANAPIHSAQYEPVAPTITMGFTTSADNGTADFLIAYQKFADPLDTKTSPYIKPNQNLGFIIELHTTRGYEAPRGVVVTSVVPTLVQINDPTEANDDNENWHNLQMLGGDPYKWYLADPLLINPADNVNALGWKYKVTYQINYTAGAPTLNYFTSSWTNTDTDNNPLLVIDRTSPQFEVDGVVVHSESSVTDNYVIPGELIDITVRFTDVSGYNNPATEPTVSIANLNTFIDGVGPIYPVSQDDISFDSANNIWVAHITGLQASLHPNITSENIVVTLQDPVLNLATSADKFVEIANQGPIVPIIRAAKYLTQLWNGDWVERIVEPLAGQTINSKIEVYIDTQHEEYIDQVWIDPVAGITIPATYTIRPAAIGELGRWVAVFEPVLASNLVAGDLSFTAHTRRIPYNAEIFTHALTFSTPVDVMDFMADTPVVKGLDIDLNWQNNIISPERDVMVNVSASNIGEDFAALLPADLSGWFTLESVPAGLFTAIPAAEISDNHTATWNIAAADVADLSLNQASVKVTYHNIYGFTKEVVHGFNIDPTTPQYTGMDLFSGADVVATEAGGMFFYDEAWDKIRVKFADLPDVFVGLHSVDVTFTPDPLTYTYNPSEYPQAAAALASMQYSPLTINQDGSGYVDITFSAPYTGTTLANGRYIITVTNLKDKFGATVAPFTKSFDWQYDPAVMTLYINGQNDNFEANVSAEPISIIANTNSSVPIQGVEFRLFYDADGDTLFTAADLNNEITGHLNNTPDLEFPYDAQWNMTADLYAFIQDAAYQNPDRAYRGFWLRASVITQNRDLYDVVKFIRVWDDVAPVPNPDLTTIVMTIDYENTANNNLNIPVALNVRDAVTVQVTISGEGGPVVLSQPVVNPLGWNQVNWDFNGFIPGTYTTMVKVWDFTGNSSEAAGPNIELQNAISGAVAQVNILHHESINSEANINGMEFNANPIDDADDYIILEGTITNPTSPSGPLNGIAAVQFGAQIVDNTGVTQNVVIATVPNNDALQPQIPASGVIASNLIYIAGGNTAIIRLAVPNSFFSPYMASGMDYSFKFNMSFTPNAMFAGINLPEQPYAMFSVDQLAPQVTVTNISGIDPVSWYPGKQGSFKITANNLQYDTNTEIAGLELEWSVDGTTWNNVVPQPVYVGLDQWYVASNWNIAGGNADTFLGENYFGPVQIRVTATDNKGNQASFSLDPPINVDNQAPATRFTHVIHSVNYPNLTAIEDLVDAPDQLAIVSSNTGTNGSSNLQLFVDAGTLGADNVMPLMMFQQTPNGIWQSVEYDHEAWNMGNQAYPNLFEFVIPSTKLTSGQHRFVVIRKDAMGNLEGDIADALGLTYGYNPPAWLSDNEKLLATDLIIDVTSIDDVIATIQYPLYSENPTVMPFIGGRKALTAVTTDDNAVDKIRFQHKVGTLWQDLGVVTKANVHPVTFELLRSDVPQYNDLPWVPGVHLFNGATELTELVWNQATESWMGTIDLNVGTNYGFQYGIDLNNNGIWDAGEPKINDPKEFVNFTPTSWTLAFNSNEYTQGLHEFRAVPLDTASAELEHYQAPSSWMIIDNVKPVINNLSSVGNISNVTPGTAVPFVTDVTELLVASDDIVNVRYEYSGQPVGTLNRKWNVSGIYLTNNMSGNYPYSWTAINPLTDNVDNNGNGLVDEAAEADGTFYIRSIAYDRAGNYQVSNEFAIDVDGSAAQMALTSIEGTVLATTNNIYNIDPALTSVILTATEIATGFGLATNAEFFYKWIGDIDNPWPAAWTQIGGVVSVIDSLATAELGFIQEGYYQFMVTAYDALQNSESNVTHVIFNDVTGPEITFTQVGARPVISEKYAFATNPNMFDGNLIAQLSNAANVSAVTFEYSLSGNDGTWVNIATTGTIPGNGIVTVPWDYPPLRAPLLYLKATAQDTNANNMSSEIVKLYHDATAPGADTAITHTVYDGNMAVDKTANVVTTLTYNNLNNDGILDVANVTLNFYDVNGQVVLTRNATYTDVNMAATGFTFTPNQMANVPEGIDSLVVIITDFAGNTSTTTAFPALYFDVYAPNIISVVSIAPNVNNNVAVNTPITFNVNYTDLIGLPTDALQVEFKRNGVVKATIDTYTVIDAQNIQFTWTPSDYDNYFANGGWQPLAFSAELSLKDYMNHVAPIYVFNVDVTYGVPDLNRIMAVRDVVNGNPAIHYVNWNNPDDITVGVISEAVGTNQTVAGAPLELYAYVPHMGEIPASIGFEYRKLGTLPWMPIDVVTTGDPQWNFIDPSFVGQFQTQFSANWNIVNLESGIYEVKTTSYYNPGFTSSVIRVNIYNGTIVPQAVVNGIAQNNVVQRGETYTLSANFTSMEHLTEVLYRYRYVNVVNGNVNPQSEWTDFGDANGIPTPVWNGVDEDYSFDWTVYPYYLFNNTVQIVAIAKDKWGTETPISSIISGTAYALANIRDTQAPDAAISYTWPIDDNNPVHQNPEWVSGSIPNYEFTIYANITSDIMLNDLARVDFKFNNVVIGTDNVAPYSFAWTGLPIDPAITSGILQVVTYDVYGNMNENTPLTINIDNVLPTANFELPANVDRGTDLVLNANAADTPAGILNVEYVYAKTTVPAQPWIAIDTVVAAPWTYEWAVPADLEFGANYTVQATITDLVGLVTTVTSNFTVTDPETPMQILTVAGHAPVNNIIPVRLHDDVTIETAVNDVNIMRVEYVIRNSEQAPWTHLEYADVVAGRADIVLSDILPGFAEGDYTLAVRAREARETLGNIAASVEVTLDHSLAIGQIVSMPANNGFFNGDTFTVNFAVTTDDELDASSIALEYRVIGIDGANDWHAPVITSSNLDRTGANTYMATFTGVEIFHTPQSLLNGMMDFRFSVSDLAAETPNTTNTVVTNVMYDTTDPEVIFTGISGTGVTEIAGNYNIQLGSTATVNGNAWDVLYGQINQVASGIDKVELWYNYNGVDVLIGTDTAAPYSFAWNTTGFSVGTYTLGMMAYDKAGNVNGAAMTVNIVPPAGWEPYALITAMSFDGDNANQDTIHAVVDRWNNEVIDQVAFEYLVGTTWTQFAAVLNPVPAQFTVSFNAELMSAATKIRSVVTYNGGIVSTSKPELSIAYSTAEGGSLTVVQPSINANVFYNNELRITGAASAPRAAVLFNGSLQSTPAVQMVNGTQTAFFTVPNHGVYKLWASAINYDNWTMQLNGATLNTYNIGTVASNGISTTVPAGSFVYFENVAPSVVLPTGFTGLSAQNAVIASPQGNLDYSVTLTTTPATNGTVVGMYYDGNQWTNVPATVTGNVATFTAPSGYIYAVAQYTGTAFNVVFSAIDPQYVSGTTLWTVADPTSIKFFVYDGMTQGGYTSPAIGDITWQMYIDDVAVASTYVNGYITAVASDLAAGAHTASVVVTMNDVEVTAEKAFNVETTQPVIVATGTQLTVSNRTISASITDPQTGILDAHLYAYNSDDPTLNITVPMENLVVAGNTYSYTFTMDDLNALGYDVNYTMPMNVVWYAANPLMPAAVTEPINYTVNIEGPAIAFAGFANGWWLNPTFTTPLTFTVTVPQGRTMPTDGVSVSLDEVTPNGNNNIQNMTLAPISVAGNVYSYSFNFGQLLSPAATAVKLNVYAIDNYNVYNMSEQTYGIDMAAPVLWAMAPVGAPIDNDGDGLFNEDVPNGVNEDLDWVDLDQDGFWDIDEPQIIDEDPIDFQDAVITQGTNVVIALGFEDYSSFQYLLPGGTTWYYTGQSGINAANIQVSLNGAPITGTVTNGTFTHNAGMLEAGHYTVVASVPDHVGNVGGLAFEFDVVGGAPTIVFNPIDGNGWWINSTEANVLTFNVNYDGEMADGGVVANIYAEPGNTLIQGPITPTPNQNVYSISLLGGVVPAGSYAVRLEVAATTAWGITSTSNQTYGIDNNAPVITLTSPAENAQFNINATVNIMASISDMVATRLANVLRSSNDSKDRPAGSGIKAVTLSVINPNGEQAFDPITYPANTQVINKAMPATVYGTYIINLMAKDYTGNQSMISRNFMVTPNTAPTVSFTEIAWLNSVGTNNLSFTVDSVVPVSVVANVFAQPSEALLMGPLNVNSPYSVALNSSMIPLDQTGVKLQVIVSDQYGNVTEANHYYNVDRIAPEVMIISPVEGVEITLVDETTAVNILAQFTDAAGSGIAGSSLVVVDPLGVQVGVATTTPADVTETSRSINDLMLGTYIVRLTVTDKAGNQQLASVSFTVIAAPLPPTPPVDLEITDAHAYPNPMLADGTGKISLMLNTNAHVNVRIYDFAGREVRSMDYNGKVMAKAATEIVFDGRNNQGVKLARGTYFARVIANDGKKIVEKVVKIAIK